jgi:Domain of unknown function (DUF4145)
MNIVGIRLGNEVINYSFGQLKLGDKSQSSGFPASIRCPHCGANGTFIPSAGGTFQQNVRRGAGGQVAVQLWYGVHCPNLDCLAPVFMIEQGGQKLLSFPPEVIDFESKNLPNRVADSLGEAIQCHAASCFKGAALLVRRTLEEVCDDRGAIGKDLKSRISSLGKIITIPQALIEAMDEIRLLGNDAAHVEAKAYDDIGAVEVEVAIDLCKELVKATYQYESLLTKIRGLKK